MARPARVSPERILAAAAVEFAARGYAGARVDRIARRAHVNKAMLYYHFGSKQGLYRTLLRSIFTEAANRLREVARGQGPATASLDRAVDAIAALAREQAFFPAIMLREIAEGGAHLDRETLQTLAAVPLAFGPIITNGIAAGAFRPVHPIAAYFTMLAPIVLYMAAGPIRAEPARAGFLDIAVLNPEAFVEHLQGALQRAFAADRPTDARSTR
jgi:AcrR family transcriptional regulator